MVKKGHKYVTLLEINVPGVMILSQKLGNFIWQGDIFWQRGTFIWDVRSFIWKGGTFIWQEGTFILTRVTILLQIIRRTKFWSCVRTLKGEMSRGKCNAFYSVLSRFQSSFWVVIKGSRFREVVCKICDILIWSARGTGSNPFPFGFIGTNSHT